MFKVGRESQVLPPFTMRSQRVVVVVVISLVVMVDAHTFFPDILILFPTFLLKNGPLAKGAFPFL